MSEPFAGSSMTPMPTGIGRRSRWRLDAIWPRSMRFGWRQLCISMVIGSLVLGVTGRALTEINDARDTTQAHGRTRDVDFTTNEGTWMSVDISPDGRWLVFDLLANIYRVPVSGGEAECLTSDSGVAENFHPRYSPDGQVIAFISDRRGGENLWIMGADGSYPRPIFTDKNIRVFEPTWTPDGKFIVVRQHQMGEGLFVTGGLWMYPRNGGTGIMLVRPDEVPLAGEPSMSPDNKSLYFEGCADLTTDGCGDAVAGGYQLYRFDRRSAQIVEMTMGPGGGIAPQVSPDGEWLAFARRIPDGTLSFKGHRFSPRTALWLRSLRTGEERVVMDPIEADLAERQHGARAVFHAERVLPGYAWALDGQSIVIAQGGKLRRVWVQNGRVDTIAFTARVHRTITEQVYSRLLISDEPFEARMLRWHTASPNGTQLVFQAIGRIWIQDLPTGSPRRLTDASFQPLEYSPAWSPDGGWIAFTTWDATNGGALWRVPVRGGSPQRISSEPGEYLNPAWSPDGREIVVTRGSGATMRGRTMSENPWYELVRFAVSGERTKVLALLNPPRKYYSGGQIWQASYGPDGRIYYPDSRATFATMSQERLKRVQQFNVSDAAGLRPWLDAFGGVVTQLISIDKNGEDRRVEMEFPYATAATPSPDGRWVAFQEGDNVYLTPFRSSAPQTGPIRVNRRKTAWPTKPLSLEGGLYPHWKDSTTIEFGSGDHYFAYHIDTGRKDSVAIHLEVSRAIPVKTIALVGARIVTLEDRRVIERGTVVVKAGRIACVGECRTEGADLVLDVSGKTIIPGWVDMHAHHHDTEDGIVPARGYENAIYLAYGITTDLDPWAWSQNVFTSAELIEAGTAIGPRTFSTGIGLWSGDSPYHNAMSTYEDVEHEVKRLVSWGAVAVKQYTLPYREQRQWAVEVARRLGLRITAEGEDNNYDIGMIMDGQTGFEHSAGYAPLYGDATIFLGKANTFYSATITATGTGMPWGDQYFRQETDLWKDPKYRQWFPTHLLMLTRHRTMRPASDYSFPILAQGMADVIAAGGHGALGSHGQQPGIGAHWDVWMIASATTPMAALEIASLDGARFLGADKDIGSISVGKLADLMILNRNPLEDIHNTIDLAFVMKGGRLYEASTLDEVWPESRPFGEHYWVNSDLLRGDDRPINYWDEKH